MGYSESMEAAGAKVIAYEEFGSYQGDWAALVEHNGNTGIVFGSFGSCPGCDAFEAEFGWNDKPEERDGKYYKDWSEEISKEEFEELLASYNKRLSDFGLSYLTPPFSTKEDIEQQISKLKEDDWFDGERKEMLEWCLSILTKNHPPNP